MHALGIFDVAVTNGFALPKKRDYALLRSLYSCKCSLNLQYFINGTV